MSTSVAMPPSSPPIALEVEWYSPSPTEFLGRCVTTDYSGEVRLTPSRIAFAGDADRLRGRPWSLDGRPMPQPLGTSIVPASEWGGLRGDTIVILASAVPAEVAAEIWDRFGVATAEEIRRWNRMGRTARLRSRAAWQAAWSQRHGRPWRHWLDQARDPKPGRPLDRDERIAAAIRTYTGRRTLRRRWPWLRPLRRHAGMPDITPADRKRVCGRLEGSA